MKRLTAVMVLVCMFSLLVVPVGAVEVEGTANYRVPFKRVISGPVSFTAQGTIDYPVLANRAEIDSMAFNDGGVAMTMLDRLDSGPSSSISASGSIGLYVTFLIHCVATEGISMVGARADDGSAMTSVDLVASVNETLVLDFYDMNGSRISSDSKEAFAGDVDGSSAYRTLSFVGRISSDTPITGFYLAPSTPYWYGNAIYATAGTLSSFISSVSLVSTQSSSELSALEDMADEIAAQSQLLETMYGDIVSLLNALNSKVSTEETLRLASQYLLEISDYSQQISFDLKSTYTLLNTYLHYLQQIAATADDIYAELQTFHDDFILKLDLLISTIMTESDDIQATMDRIYQQLISYLEATYTEAINPEFEDTREGFDGLVDDTHAIEQEWTGSLSDAWDALDAESVQLDGSLVSGVMWVSSWMQNIFNAAGPYRVVILLSLYVGVCRFILGVTSVVSSESVDEDAGADDG